jgi:penicillin-binding protein 1C
MFIINKIKAGFRRIGNFHSRHRYKLLVVYTALLLGYYFYLPSQLFDAPYSTVLFDRNGKLLGAKIASDGQWRFPNLDSVPHKFRTAILAFEDKRFYSHWGVDFRALGRALWQNTSSGQKVSGASTLTMQVMRLSRGNPSRTIVEKMKEMVLASRLEWSYSKDEILLMYASHAPFGGNVVGLETAAWKYFSRSAHQLSWAESCMLAVLPNSPSLIHISRNRQALLNKRNSLLDRLWAQGSIDSLTCALSKIEPLPEAPPPLPMLAPHLLERVHGKNLKSKDKSAPNSICRSTLDVEIQRQVSEILARHYDYLSGNEIHNAAALVIDVESNDILAYVGNIPNIDKQFQGDVDIIPAQRSSGSILKPFLYAAMLHDGEMSPKQLYPDVPTHFKGYTPKNYNSTYSGAVPAQVMIEQSLNVPAIYMLNQYGTTRFLHKLQQVGMTTLQQNADHYGLTLILGGAECTLWDLASMYAGMARSLRYYRQYNGKYDQQAYLPIHFLQSQRLAPADPLDNQRLQATAPLRASAIWHTFEAMQEVARPGDENYWRAFANSNRIAWKTGTSFGFRDAWAVGCTPQYVVAVWAGNANGEGRPGLVGVKAAAPILFDIFSALGGNRRWFERPLDDMQQMLICRQSGHLAGEFCSDIDSVYITSAAQKTSTCPYHQKIFLSPDGKFRVHSDCESPLNMRSDTFFVLPPAQEWFFKKYNLLTKIVPPFRPDCHASSPSGQKKDLAFLYPPQQDLKIYVPTELDEQKSRVVFEVAHKGKTGLLYWHLDSEFVGSTHEFHQLGLNPDIGKHTITAVSEDGESISRRFEIIGKE